MYEKYYYNIKFKVWNVWLSTKVWKILTTHEEYEYDTKKYDRGMENVTNTSRKKMWSK